MSDQHPHDARPARPPMDMPDLLARRRRARHGRRLARFDVALAVAVALTLVLVSPGLAITAIVALLTLAVCLVSFLIAHRRRLRGQRRATVARRGPKGGATSSATPSREARS
jgi:Flp pilus assembly protein TadB